MRESQALSKLVKSFNDKTLSEIIKGIEGKVRRGILPSAELDFLYTLTPTQREKKIREIYHALPTDSKYGNRGQPKSVYGSLNPSDTRRY